MRQRRRFLEFRATRFEVSGANSRNGRDSTTTRADSQIRMNPPRHFLDFADFSADEIRALLKSAAARKAQGDAAPATLSGRFLLLIMAKPSTRTRVSFAAAIARAGGSSAALDFAASQMSRGESPADAARAVSAMCHAVVIRTGAHSDLTDFAAAARCPVINGLTNRSHPCQTLADLQTFAELRGDIRGKKIAWVGDANNVFFSWAQAAEMLDFEFAAACPPEFQNPQAPDCVRFCDSPAEAAAGAALVMTDVWASMGDENERARRVKIFKPYQVDAALMAKAKADAIFMHCLPAHRGEEVAAEVLDGPQSAAWVQAENRMHAQRALLEFLLNGGAEGAKQ